MMQDRTDEDIRPNPDPTRLSTAALNLAITSQERLFDAKLQTVREVTNLRLSAMEGRLTLLMALIGGLAVLLMAAAAAGLAQVFGA